MSDIDAKLEGWKQIAQALGVSEDTAQRYARRDGADDPLLVRHGHRGPWLFVWYAKAWVLSQDKPYKTHLECGRHRRAARCG